MRYAPEALDLNWVPRPAVDEIVPINEVDFLGGIEMAIGQAAWGERVIVLNRFGFSGDRLVWIKRKALTSAWASSTLAAAGSPGPVSVAVASISAMAAEGAPVASTVPMSASIAIAAI